MHNVAKEVLSSVRAGTIWAGIGAALGLAYHQSWGGMQDTIGAALSWATNATFAPFLAAAVIALGVVEVIRSKENGHIPAAKFLKGLVLRVIGLGLGVGLAAGLVGEGWVLALTSLGYATLVLFLIGAVVAFPPVREGRDMLAALRAFGNGK